MKRSFFAPGVVSAVAFSALVAVLLVACAPDESVDVQSSRLAEHLPTDAAVEPVDKLAQEDSATGTASLPVAIEGLHQPRAGLYTAGQPGPAAWRAVADAGITTVINLRPEAEMGGRDEAAEVAAAGLNYQQIPVAGAGDINIVNATQLRRLIDQAPGPVLVHCASGNRVGALLALSEMESGEVSTEQALAFGRSAGLGSLEPRVREVIESLPEATCKADASC